MKKNVFFFFAFIVAPLAFSQVGIGTENPNPDALLEINATDHQGGLLLPRVALVSTIDAAPLTAHVQGMTLYNTATTTGENAVVPGYYYNDGAKWVKLNAAAGSYDMSTVWGLGGNADTDPDTDFIGTTDEQPLAFKVKGKRAGFLDNREDGNLFFGLYAGNPTTTGKGNVAIGSSALSFNTTGYGNTANGYQALYFNTTGGGNTANGSYALLFNTTGDSNTANGSFALFSNTTGGSNTANGYEALRSNTTGRSNTANGSYALFSNTTGGSNTANGSYALHSNTTGYGNTANGVNALFFNTTGSANTANGFEALLSNTTGDSNTALGFRADVVSGDLSNATAIGFNAKVNASNKVRIGNTVVTVIEGQVPFTTPSDARFKTNVQQNVPGLAFINQLQPVTYYFDNQKMSRQLGEASKDQPSASKKIQTGFLAQDVEKAAQALNYSFDGVHAPENSDDYYTLSYSQFVVPLVQAVKEQQAIIDAQNMKTDALSKEVEEQRTMIQSQQALIKDLQNEMAEMKSQLNP